MGKCNKNLIYKAVDAVSIDKCRLIESSFNAHLFNVWNVRYVCESDHIEYVSIENFYYTNGLFMGKRRGHIDTNKSSNLKSKFA